MPHMVSRRLVARFSANRAPGDNPYAAQPMFPASKETASRMATAPHHGSITVDHCVWTYLFLLRLTGIPHVLVGVGE